MSKLPVIKNVVTIFNVVIMIMGIVSISVSISELHAYSPDPLSNSSIFMELLPGLILVAVSILGFVAVKRCSFPFLFSLIFCHAMLIGWPIISLLDTYLPQTLEDILNNVKSPSANPQETLENLGKMAYLQQKYSCCGRDGLQEFVEWGLDYPISCYRNQERSASQLFQDGCLEAVKSHALNNFTFIRVISWMQLVINFFAIFPAFILYGHLATLHPNHPFLVNLKKIADCCNLIT